MASVTYRISADFNAAGSQQDCPCVPAVWFWEITAERNYKHKEDGQRGHRRLRERSKRATVRAQGLGSASYYSFFQVRPLAGTRTYLTCT